MISNCNCNSDSDCDSLGGFLLHSAVMMDDGLSKSGLYSPNVYIVSGLVDF